MFNSLVLVITGLTSFIFFISLLIAGIRLKSKVNIIGSLALFILSLTCFGLLLVMGAGKVYQRGVKAFAGFYQPRTSEKIYFVLFGRSIKDCSEIINLTDQIVPRLDCCIWLEFKTCPAELKRIIALEKYTSTTVASSDLDHHLPTYSPRPEWWTPHKLNTAVTLLRSYNPENPNRDKILIFAADSAHVYYCDMAD
jgi:hypothetical protein